MIKQLYEIGPGVLALDPHNKSNTFVVCDRFETGYDNPEVTLLGMNRRMSSEEKLVQVYSRATS